MNLKYTGIDTEVVAPSKATSQSACYDLRAHFGPSTRICTAYLEDNSRVNICAFKDFENDKFAIEIPAKARVLVPTGLIFDIPEGYSIRIHSRSGLSLKQGLTLRNAEGVVDSDYTEQTYVMLYNGSKQTAKISHGDRIAQFEMVPVLQYNLQQVDRSSIAQKTDRSGGFGSTGV